MKMFRQIECCSESAWSWKTVTIPISRVACTEWFVSRLPFPYISPWSGWWTPVSVLIRVDLPAPLFPRRPTTSFRPTSKSTPSRETMLPNLTLMSFRRTIVSRPAEPVSANVRRFPARPPDPYIRVPLIGGVSSGPKDTFDFWTSSSPPPENRQTYVSRNGVVIQRTVASRAPPPVQV
jgi:hypothetical protein